LSRFSARGALLRCRGKSEFNMTAPSVGGFVTVADRATMEFDLHLRRA
jgi:hypothetical protein